VAATSILALVAIDLDATSGFTWKGTDGINRSVRRSAVVLLVATVVAWLVHNDLVVTATVAGTSAFHDTVTANALLGFVAVQVELLAAALLFGPAVAALDRWLDDDQWAGAEDLRGQGLGLTDVPLSVWGVLVVECWAALVPAVTRLVGDVLASLSVVGTAFALVFATPYLHAVLAVVVLVLAGIVAADAARRIVLDWVGTTPPRAVAHAAGGLVATVLTLLVVGLPPVGRAVAALVTPETTGTFGAGTVLLATVLLALVLLWLTLAVALLVEGASWVPTRTGGFAMGAACLFLGSLAAGFAGVAAPLVFVGVAATILSWDLGEHATDLGALVADGSETRRAEVVHATGSVLVGVVAVVVATVGAYVVVPFAPLGTAGGNGDWRSFLALVLALVALVAFVRALDRRESDASGE
jgi:hypothetical protein